MRKIKNGKKLRKQLRKGSIKLKTSYKKAKPKLRKIRKKGIDIRENINDYFEMCEDDMRKIARTRGRF